MTPEQLQSGVLCQLRIGRWDAMVRLPKHLYPEDMPKKIIRSRQQVLEDRTLLMDLATIRRSSKGWLERHSMPFPIDGVNWINRETIPKADEAFTEFQAEYWVRRDRLKSQLGKEKQKFKRKYPKHYNEKYYPTKDEIDKKFYFYWNFFQIDVPDIKTGILPPEVYKKELAKMQGMVKEMEEMTLNMVGNMLFKRVKTLAKQCDTGKVNAATVGSIETFLKRWDNLWRDHVDEKRLKVLMSQLRRQIDSTTTERLKGNEDFRNNMQKHLEKTMGKIKNIPNFTLKPKLDV